MASPSSPNGRHRLTPRRVVVTGVGAVTSLAPTATETWERILAGESGLKRVDLDPEQNPCLVRGDVDDATISNRFLDAKTLRNTSRFSRMAVEAAGEALIDAGLIGEDGSPSLTCPSAGTVIGTCVGGAHDDLLPAWTTYENRGPGRVPPHLHVMFPLNLASYTIQWRSGMQGPSNTVNTACATGSQAIGEAFHQVKYGKANIMVAGAVESDSHPMFIAGFAVMKALATDSNDNPTGGQPAVRHRAGPVSCSARARHGRARGIRACRGARREDLCRSARLRLVERCLPPDRAAAGWQRLAPRRSATRSPMPASNRTRSAMSRRTPPRPRSVIPPKRTRSRQVFGERAGSIPVTSIKGAIGHCMGAAGAIESVIAVLSMANQTIPPTLNYTTPDDEIGLDIVHGEPRKADFAVSTKHSFGLGGQNACLVFGRVD